MLLLLTLTLTFKRNHVFFSSHNFNGFFFLLHNFQRFYYFFDLSFSKRTLNLPVTCTIFGHSELREKMVRTIYFILSVFLYILLMNDNYIINADDNNILIIYIYFGVA